MVEYGHPDIIIEEVFEVESAELSENKWDW